MHARGEGEVRFEDDNALLRFSEKREVRAGASGAKPMLESTATFEAKRVKEGAFESDASTPTKLASKLPGELFESEAEKHAALTRRAEGATIEDIIGGIGAAAVSGPEALPKGWLVRSTALLELDPSCSQRSRFDSKTTVSAHAGGSRSSTSSRRRAATRRGPRSCACSTAARLVMTSID